MNNKLPILALETSGNLCSVAVMIDEKTYAESSINQKHVHSEKLMALIKNTMDNSGVELNGLGHIAISVGPGSFTGLRIGMAAAKGLALGANLPIVPVSAFNALAKKICNYIPEGQKFVIANTVNITELYFAKYTKENDSYIEAEKLQLLPKTDFEKMIKNDELVFGNYHDFKSLSGVAFPSALDIAHWSYIYGQDLMMYEYDYLEPNYLKNFVVKMPKKN